MEVANQLQFVQTTYENRVVNQPVSPYRYTAVSERHNEFRLIRLEPSNDLASPMVACLQHHSLLDPPPYVALSYEVGNPGFYRLVLLDGVQVPVSANLFAALHHLRHLGVLLLWIDSLCIDQSSDEEKSSQILRIQVIYQEARQVIAWLGPDMHGAWKVMRHISSSRRSQTRSQRPSSRMVKQTDESLLPELQAFFLRSYWRRVWVIQEVVAASRVTVFCGWEIAEWEGLEGLVSRLTDRTFRKRYPLPTKAVECLIQFRQDRIEGRPMSMLEVLHRSSLSKSTYPKDKVYAMLRLAFDKSTFISEPRYRWSDEELCMRMTRSFISSKQSLDIIFVGGKSQKSILKLPSWSPDYTAFPSGPAMSPILKYVSGQDERTRLGVLGRRWKTTGSTTVSEKYCMVIQGLLRVKGAWVATIHDTANLIGEPKVGRPVNRPLFDFLYTPSERKNDQLGRTLFLYSKDYKRHEKQPGVFNHLLYAFDADDYRHEELNAMPEFRPIVKWRQVNKDFYIHRYPLYKYRAGTKTQKEDMYVPDHKRDDADYLYQQIQSHNSSSSFSSKGPSIDLISTLTALTELIDEGMRLMMTREGFPGWAHPCAESGDRIYLLAGCSMPVILRPHAAVYGAFSVVGHAYVDGMMDGDFWQDCVDRGLYDVDIF